MSGSRGAQTFLTGVAVVLFGLAAGWAQPTVPPSQIPAGLVNTNDLGWTARTVLITTDEQQFAWMSSASNMEAALGPVSLAAGGFPTAGQAVSQFTGLYCSNAANFAGGNNPQIQNLLNEQFGTPIGGCLVPSDTNGYWTLDAGNFTYAYINCDADQGPLDVTGPFNAPLFPKNYFPGIPGNTGEADWETFATSFTGYMYLSAGTNIFNVNSDDGFILFISPSPNPNDASWQVRAGEFDSPRGVSTTVVPVVVLQAGWYSVRLDYFQNTSPAACAFFTTDGNGSNVLINDTTTPTALLAYPAPETFPAPYAATLSPPNGTTGYPPDEPPAVVVQIQDGTAAAVDPMKPFSISMNGTVWPGVVVSNVPSYTPNGRRLGNLTIVSAHPPPGFTLPGASTIPIEADYTDKDGQSTNVVWQIQTTGLLVQSPNATINTNLPGFVVYPFQEAGAATNDVLGQAEEQILGVLGPNTATLARWPSSESGVLLDALPGPQGLYFLETNTINWNLTNSLAGDDFDFKNGYPPSEFPGIVGGGYSGETGLPANRANFQMLVETWLYFPEPGIYVLGVNGTDGFSLRNGAAPADVFGSLLGVFEGGRGAADSRVPVLVLAQGYYPFRLLYEHAGANAEIEFYSMTGIDAGSARQLVNDSTNSIQAFSSASFYSPCVGGVCPPADRGGLDPNTPLVVQLVDGMTDGRPDAVVSAQVYTNGALMTGLTSVRASGGTTIRSGAQAAPVFPSGSNSVSVVYLDSNDVLYTNSWSFSLAAASAPGLRLNPPVVSGNQAVITWTGAGTLQQASRLTGQAADWSDVPGAGGITYTATVGAGSSQFFRLRQ